MSSIGKVVARPSTPPPKIPYIKHIERISNGRHWFKYHYIFIISSGHITIYINNNSVKEQCNSLRHLERYLKSSYGAIYSQSQKTRLPGFLTHIESISTTHIFFIFKCIKVMYYTDIDNDVHNNLTNNCNAVIKIK